MATIWVLRSEYVDLGFGLLGLPTRGGASADFLPFPNHRVSVYKRREVHLDPGVLGEVTNWTCFAQDFLVSH